MRKIRCWWLGCEIHEQDPRGPEHATCVHCGDIVSYGDFVGDTRHRHFMDRLRRLNPMRLIPAKCDDCGKRFGSHDKCDLIPF